jgi:hypothetical protein
MGHDLFVAAKFTGGDDDDDDDDCDSDATSIGDVLRTDAGP